MTLIAAHRGASLSLPDNSLRSFSAAIESGCDLIETDVRADRSGRLVLSHDPVLSHEEPVTLDALLALARGEIGLDLEIKERVVVGELVAALDDWPGELILTSFQARTLAEVRALAPEIATGLLVERGQPDPIVRLRDSGADALLVRDDLADATLVHRCPRALWVWTVNDPERLAQLLTTRALAALITDDPELAMSLRDRS